MKSVVIEAHFNTLEDKLVWEAVVYPELKAVLEKYQNLFSAQN